MRILSVFAAAFLIGAGGVANAELPVQVAPQFGVYLTKSFGAQQVVPVEFGAKFHYGEVNAEIYDRDSKRYRPALFDLRFSSQGLSAFETAGVSVLQPAYMLGAGEGGFFSSINWGLVGFALLGAGIYAAAEDDRDDREERIAAHKADTKDGSVRDGETGGEAAGDGGVAEGGDEGGGDPVLGCDPVLGTGQCL